MGNLAKRLAPQAVKQIRILTIDIETKPMKVYSFGLFNQFHSIDQIIEHGGLLCFAAKWAGGNEILFFSEWEDGQEAMVRAAYELLTEADVVVHYNGDRFDVKHLNQEFDAIYGGPPRPYKTIDLLKTNKNRFALPSKKLDYLAQRLGVGAKTKHTGFQLWKDVMDGVGTVQTKARALMRKYNEQDVRITEKAYFRLLPWLTNTPHLGMFLREDPFVCPYCGGKTLDLDGLAHTNVQSYDMFQCRRCHGWSRGIHRKQDPTRTRAIR